MCKHAERKSREMKQPIIHDQFFMSKKSQAASKQDLKIAEDLKDTLLSHHNEAAGLAANMIGQRKRIIAFYIGSLAMVMLNPEITEQKQPYLTQEGCLSLTGMRPTTRYKEITVRYRDLNWQKEEQSFSGFVAETIQHEIDHCNGKII